MTKKVLTTYLNDHLAGSVAALALLDHLISSHSNHSTELAQLRRDIGEDQRVLQQLLAELGGHESQVRKAAAWLTQKLGQAKLQFDDPGDGELSLFEALETLGLGIQGKLSLWRALAEVKDQVPQWTARDFDRLQQRALDQFERIDRMRLRSARAALIR